MNPPKNMEYDGNTTKGRRLVVFWEGTSNTIEPLTTQIGLFSRACQAAQVDSAEDVMQISPSSVPLKISFDGCGVTHGTWGVLLASGLDEQCQVVLRIVEKMLQLQPPGRNGTGVHVVAVGLSRGGMACMKLAQLLSAKPHVTCSTLLFDPVPGNAVSTGFPWTASGAYDLSRCSNLKRVLALYPYEALPDIAMHAPTLGQYNRQTTLVQEDVTPGCHQGALLLPQVAPTGQFPALNLRRILDFLELEGVQCRMPIHVPSPADCIRLMKLILKRAPSKKAVRKAHDRMRRKIFRHGTSDSKKKWLNRHHEQLVQEVNLGNPSSTLEAVYGTGSESGSYLLDFDEGHVLCPSPFFERGRT